jgi:hypothetical protein
MYESVYTTRHHGMNWLAIIVIVVKVTCVLRRLFSLYFEVSHDVVFGDAGGQPKIYR